MIRYAFLLASLVWAVGCGAARSTSDLGTGLADSETTAKSRELAKADPLPPGLEVGDDVPTVTRSPDEQWEERRIAADSAADEAVLEELAAAHPTESDSTDSILGPETLPNAVTWDIDVETYSDHDRVQYYLEFFEKQGRERMGVWLERMTRYEAMIRERLRREGLPEDLVYIALIESGFSNTATSRAKAVGMWQFMKGTAQHYGLRIDSWVDERRDPFRATDAAVRHLRDLTQRFGSVYLAAAAYNAGAGRVSRGIGALPEGDAADSVMSDATFFRLYDTKLLHRETKDYVPKLIAAARMAKEPERYGFTVTPQPPAAYDSILVPDMTGLDVIARLADTTLAAIREMNLQYLREVTPPDRRSVVRLPAGRGERTALAYAALPAKQRIAAVEHKIRRGETLSGIAQRYGVKVAAIVDANPRVNPQRILAGSTIVIPTGKAAGSSQFASAKAPAAKSPAKTPASKPTWHQVRKGETLSDIAENYGVSIGNLRTWNAISGSRILAGQRLRVTAPSRAEQAPKRKPRSA